MSNMQFYFAMGAPTLTTLLGIFLVRSDVKDLRGEMKDLRGEMKDLRGDMKSLRDGLRADMSDLRSEVHQSVLLLTGKVLEHTDRLARIEQRLDNKN